MKVNPKREKEVNKKMKREFERYPTQDGDESRQDTIDPTQMNVADQVEAIQQDYLTGNFQAESHLLNHLKLQTENIDNEMIIKRQIQTMLEKEKSQPQAMPGTISETTPQLNGLGA